MPRPPREYQTRTLSTGDEGLKTYSAITQLKQAFSGGLSGCLTRTVTQPLDVLKIRFQLQVEPIQSAFAHMSAAAASSSSSKYTSIVQACRVICQEEGCMALWKGHNSGQLLTVVYTLSQFWAYEQLDLRISQMPMMSERRSLARFLSGGLAGCIGTAVSMPFDVVRTRVVAQDPKQKYTSMFQLVPIILRAEGVPGLFRGLGTNLLQIGPLIGFNFMFYHNINDVCLTILQPENHQLPFIVLLVTGGFAGVASKGLVYPLDFIKKRLQLQSFREARQTFGRNQTCTGICDCITLTLREEGALGFYKGIGPTLLKSGVTTALYFGIYDMLKKFLGIYDK